MAKIEIKMIVEDENNPLTVEKLNDMFVDWIEENEFICYGSIQEVEG